MGCGGQVFQSGRQAFGLISAHDPRGLHRLFHYVLRTTHCFANPHPGPPQGEGGLFIPTTEPWRNDAARARSVGFAKAWVVGSGRWENQASYSAHCTRARQQTSPNKTCNPHPTPFLPFSRIPGRPGLIAESSSGTCPELDLGPAPGSIQEPALNLIQGLPRAQSGACPCESRGPYWRVSLDGFR